MTPSSRSVIAFSNFNLSMQSSAFYTSAYYVNSSFSIAVELLDAESVACSSFYFEGAAVTYPFFCFDFLPCKHKCYLEEARFTYHV